MICPRPPAISEIFTRIIIWKSQEITQSLKQVCYSGLEASKHCFSEINQLSSWARDRQDVVWFVYVLICPEGSLGPQQKPRLIKQIFILDCFVVMEAVFYYYFDKVSTVLTEWVTRAT